MISRQITQPWATDRGLLAAKETFTTLREHIGACIAHVCTRDWYGTTDKPKTKEKPGRIGCGNL